MASRWDGQGASAADCAGVVEITSVAWEVGYWRFEVRDAASYFGLGERFDALDHAHTVVKNLSMDNAGVKEVRAKADSIFHEHYGVWLWVDTTGEATFDMNTSERDEVVVDVTAEKLRIVLFTGPEFPGILERFTAQAGGRWCLQPGRLRRGRRGLSPERGAGAEDVDRTRELGCRRV